MSALHSIPLVSDRSPERGSALIAAVFVMVLLTGMALILLFVADTEVKLARADVRSKQAFYLAETGTETGREQLRQTMVAAKSAAIAPLLDTAAGSNDALDFDAANVRPTFDGSGNLTGFTGVGDDVPVVPITALDEGWYAAFLTNDPADGPGSPTDSNNFAMVTGIGVGPDRAVEVAQAIVQPGSIFPTLPATITLLGPEPELKHGSGKGWAGIECPEYPDKDDYLGLKIKGSKIYVSGALVKGSKMHKAYNGTDCPPYRELGPIHDTGSKLYASLTDTGGTGGIPGVYMPTYGVVGATAESDLEGNMGSKIDFLSDGTDRTAVVRPALPTSTYQDIDTVADLTDGTEPTVIGSGLGTLHPTWSDCAALKQIVEDLRTVADYECTAPMCTMPATNPQSVTFINGDYRVDCGTEGYGMLVATGELDFPASSSWHGVLFVIGEGKFYRVKKDGYGNITGGTVVADIAGPDNVYGTADDCTCGSGSKAEICSNGFSQVYFEEQKKKHKGTTAYCSADIVAADPGFNFPTTVEAFRQR